MVEANATCYRVPKLCHHKMSFSEVEDLYQLLATAHLKRTLYCIKQLISPYYHVIGVYLPSQSVSESTIKKIKPTNLCAPREFLKKKKTCLPCLTMIRSRYLDYSINKMLCSLNLDVLRAQRIMGFLILITYKSMGS